MGTINIRNINTEECSCPKLGEQVSNNLYADLENSRYTTVEQTFKVKNLLSELKSDWQKAEARKNLKTTDIVKFTQTKFGEGPNDENVWEMVTSVGGQQKIYRFVVKNGSGVQLPEIRIGNVTLVDSEPSIQVFQGDSEIVFDFALPRGFQGEPGPRGASISKVTLYYKTSSSSTSAPSSGWSTSYTEPTASQPYLWTYLSFTMSDNKQLKSSAFILKNYQASTPGSGSIQLSTTIVDNPNMAVASSTLKEALDKKADTDMLKTINGQSIYKTSDGDSDNITISGGGTSIQVDNTLDQDSSHAIENGAVTKAILDRALISNFAKINNTPVYDPNNPGKNIEIPTSLNNFSVGVYSSEENANATICFFPDGLLQGVGLYNILLRDGSITGNDGRVYKYNPNKLYHIYNDGSFEELENDETKGQWTTFDDTRNLVYYNYINRKGHNRQLTTLKHYGEIIPSNTVLYAQTSDTAYFSLQVSGPFFGDDDGNTKVKVDFDDSKIQIEQVEVTGITQYQTNKNEWLVRMARVDLYPIFNIPRVSKTNITSGSYIQFDNTNYHKSKYFIIRRKYNKRTSGPAYEDLTIPLNTTITLSTPVENIEVLVKFSKSYLLFKRNEQSLTSLITPYNPKFKTNASGNIAYRGVVTKATSQDALQNNLYITGSFANDVVASNFNMNLDKKYCYYIKVRTKPNAYFFKMAAKWNDWAKSNGTNSSRLYDSSIRGFADELTDSYFYKYGESIFSTILYQCRVEDGDVTHYIPNMKLLNNGKAEIKLDLEYYATVNGTELLIEEIGVLEYDDNDPVEIGQSKLVIKK